ncbi:MAG TPA: CZB domain-containing protein [Usitatibacter sp.]|nr:CZB domain-containing protein [Usitatibacter sp.]
MNLEHAIEKHAEWKLRFRTAMSKHETLDEAVIAKDDCCELGKWLHGDGKRRFGSLPGYLTCVARHAAFHGEAAKVAQAVNARRYEQAESMLEGNTTYADASTAVGVAILRLKKEAGL